MGTLGFLGAVLVIVMVVGALAAYPVAYRSSDVTKTVTVKEKWVKYHDNDAKYLFSDTKGNVYSIEDSFWLWRWDASDRYANLDAGETYTITTYGWRVHICSWYPNAVGIEGI